MTCNTEESSLKKMTLLLRLAYLFRHIQLTKFRIRLEACQCCQKHLLIRLNEDEMGVRCGFCGASSVSQSLARVFNKQIKQTDSLAVYELSSRGAFVKMLKQSNHQITLSEYFPDIPTGTVVQGIHCQDVQNLSFSNEQFDVCTSLEVFDHVENDIRGFQELYRVLKPGGCILFTVPLDLSRKTVERTAIVNGQRQQILPAEYHSDKLRGCDKVFCYRNYGYDITDRLYHAGLNHVKIIQPHPQKLFGKGRPVILAHKS